MKGSLGKNANSEHSLTPSLGDQLLCYWFLISHPHSVTSHFQCCKPALITPAFRIQYEDGRAQKEPDF